ncbi:hypothetical protein ILYODFUR_034260 [Ilyodon furcidens]|uniref:Uncharacterized protein n=1 Tax=Ilyodon furcidens TaxID=33524 RepID=A0ABV0T2T3_9TELE
MTHAQAFGAQIMSILYLERDPTRSACQHPDHRRGKCRQAPGKLSEDLKLKNAIRGLYLIHCFQYRHEPGNPSENCAAQNTVRTSSFHSHENCSCPLLPTWSQQGKRSASTKLPATRMNKETETRQPQP